MGVWLNHAAQQAANAGLITNGALTGVLQHGQAVAIPVPATKQPAGPCGKCRGRGWNFVSVLDGTTARCACREEEVF